MPTAETLLLVTLAGLALSASPGPSMLYVLSRTVGQSRAAGLASAAGLAVGGMVLALAAAVGLASIFAYSPRLYTVTKWLGAGYLIYLGVGMLRERPVEPGTPEHLQRGSISRIFWQGILVEALNPKTLLFFVSFLPPFVRPDQGSVAIQMLILGALVPLTAVPSDLVVAFTGSAITRRLTRNPSAARALNGLGAVILFGLGISILLR